MLLTSLIVLQMSMPDPLYMLLGIRPTTGKQLWSVLPSGYGEEKLNRNSRKQVLDCEIYNKNHQQAVGESS